MTKTYKLDTKKPALWILLLLISFGSINAALFTPALPTLHEFFHIDSGTIEFTISIFMIGYALSQLFYGPYANRFGRKQAIYLIALLTLIGNILCILSDYSRSFSLLLIGRFISAIGSCGGLTLALTIINDYFFPKDARKMVAYTSVAFAIYPFIGVLVGGFIAEYIGWLGCFYFLSVYAIFIFFCASLLPETHPNQDLDAMKWRKIFSEFKIAFSHISLIKFASVMGCATSIIYIFIGTAPYIGIVRMGLSPFLYGSYALIIGFSYFLGNMVSAYISKHLKALYVIMIGILISFIGSGALAILLGFHYFHPLGFFILSGIVYFGLPMIYSNAFVLATEQLTNHSTASSAATFVTMSLATIFMIAISAFHNFYIYATPATFLIVLLIAYFVVYFHHPQTDT